MNRACAIVLPAAGLARRMRGGDKLLEPVGGVALLRHAAQQALQASSYVAVTLRPEKTRRLSVLLNLPVHVLTVPDADEGMAASLRAGARWAGDAPVSALMIALPDMPDIAAGDFRALIAAQAENPDQCLRAASMDHRPGHPVIVPRRLFPDMLELRGDQGARAILRANPPRLYPLDGQRALTDLDTPEDWAAWRKAH
ncbi:nucleotidyltransferase family protein [Roseinatronobacter alkalisoli]|uniref:Nucleotidyltransferase family protein n=1 Tax=Roseinatronobacter alkalisoli TaxID=3028235 RepID=A0ABT5TCD2_9RHOB|nr:nucleotidyltransferase family protein [Roseinatronobacter sp. HJB301]MDD7972619.1 nucleotidyltransferase family protein [Roseinatronobacter sp. HJB301]